MKQFATMKIGQAAAKYSEQAPLATAVLQRLPNVRSDEPDHRRSRRGRVRRGTDQAALEAQLAQLKAENPASAGFSARYERAALRPIRDSNPCRRRERAVS